jgi:hypothetical protein
MENEFSGCFNFALIGSYEKDYKDNDRDEQTASPSTLMSVSGQTRKGEALFIVLTAVTLVSCYTITRQ